MVLKKLRDDEVSVSFFECFHSIGDEWFKINLCLDVNNNFSQCGTMRLIVRSSLR